MRSNRRAFQGITAVLLAVLVACSEDPVDPATQVGRVSISVDTARASSLGDTLVLSAKVLNALGAEMPGQGIEWSSRQPTIVSSAGEGRFVALTNGQATIIASSVSNTAILDSAIIVVAQSATELRIDSVTSELTALGDRTTLTASARDARGNPVAIVGAQWSSSNAAVATVNATTGEVTAISVGTTEITVNALGRQHTKIITVRQDPASVQLSALSHTFSALQDSLRLTAVVRDRRGNVIPAPPLTWSSTNAAIATVTGSGVVRALANGAARIRATSGAASDSTFIAVSQVPVRISVTPDLLRLEPGAAAVLTAAVRDANGHLIPDVEIHWTKVGESFNVSQAGLVTATSVVGYGEVTARYGALSAIASVHVGSYAEFPGVRRDMDLGVSNLPLIARSSSGVFIGEFPQVEWTSLTPGVVSIPGPGQINILTPGVGKLVGRLGTVVDTSYVIGHAGTSISSVTYTDPLLQPVDIAASALNTRVTRGQSFSRDISLHVRRAVFPGDVGDAVGTLRFDPAVLQYDSARAVTFESALTVTQPSPGELRFHYTRASASNSVLITLARMFFTVKNSAQVGTHMPFELSYDAPPRTTGGALLSLPLIVAGKVIVVQ